MGLHVIALVVGRVVGLLCVVLVFAGVGCSRGGLGDRPTGVRVDAGAFRGASVEGGGAGASGNGGVIPPAGRRVVEETPTLAVGSFSGSGLEGWRAMARPVDEFVEPVDVEGLVGVGGGLTLDARVGQINGEPVFANVVLEPLDGALRVAAADAANERAWLRSSSEIIAREVRRQVENTLILAEARSNLTADQRAGLPTFLQRIRESLAADERGSMIMADDQLRRREGVTLDQKVQQLLDEELIRNELRTRVESAVVVPFVNVRLEYQRRFEEFNPPTRAVFRLLWVREGDAGSIEEVSSNLAGGMGFLEAANKPYNERWRRDEGRWVRTFRGEFSEASFFEIEGLQAVASGLQVGEFGGPVDVDLETSRYRAWVYLEMIERPRAVTLADAQQEIYQQLLNAERDKAGERYFTELYSRGSFTPMEEMAIRLVEIATERYKPEFLGALRSSTSTSSSSGGS